MGSQVRGVNLEKTESGTRPEGGLILKQVRGLNLEKTEAGTRRRGSHHTCPQTKRKSGGAAATLVLNLIGSREAQPPRLPST